MAEDKQNLEADLLCSICMEMFQQPVVLPCEHSFCRKCIGLFAEKSKSEQTDDALNSEGKKDVPQVISCPMCRAVTSLGGDGVGGLPVNFKLEETVENYQFSSVERVEDRIPLCSICEEDDKGSAVKFCTTCCVLYCKDCLAAFHPMKGALKRHRVISAEEYLSQQSSESEMKSDKESNYKEFCAGHDQPFCLYCVPCRVVMCLGCMDEHPEHGTRGIRSAAEKIKPTSLEKASELEKILKETNDLLSGFLSLQNKIQENKDLHTQDVQRAYSAALDDLNAWRVNALENIQTLYSQWSVECGAGVKHVKMQVEELERMQHAFKDLLSSEDVTFLQGSEMLNTRMQDQSTENRISLGKHEGIRHKLLESVQRNAVVPRKVTVKETPDEHRDAEAVDSRQMTSLPVTSGPHVSIEEKCTDNFLKVFLQAGMGIKKGVYHNDQEMRTWGNTGLSPEMGTEKTSGLRQKVETEKTSGLRQEMGTKKTSGLRQEVETEKTSGLRQEMGMEGSSGLRQEMGTEGSSGLRQETRTEETSVRRSEMTTSTTRNDKYEFHYDPYCLPQDKIVLDKYSFKNVDPTSVSGNLPPKTEQPSFYRVDQQGNNVTCEVHDNPYFTRPPQNKIFSDKHSFKIVDPTEQVNHETLENTYRQQSEAFHGGCAYQHKERLSDQEFRWQEDVVENSSKERRQEKPMVIFEHWMWGENRFSAKVKNSQNSQREGVSGISPNYSGTVFKETGPNTREEKHLRPYADAAVIALMATHRTSPQPQMNKRYMTFNNMETLTYTKKVVVTKEGLTLMLYSGDITALSNVDCIVNSTDPELQHGGGAAAAIKAAAGPAFIKACEGQKLRPTQCTSTGAGNLPYKRILHVFLERWEVWKEKNCISQLKDTINSILKEANKEKMTSLALPGIGTGGLKFPIEKWVKCVVQVIKEYSKKLKDKPLKEIHFVDRNPEFLLRLEGDLREVFPQTWSQSNS